MDIDLEGRTFEAVVPLDRYPDFCLPTGTVVTVKEAREDCVWAEVSEYHSELDEWDNCVSWDRDGYPGIEDARLAFLGDTRPYTDETPDPFPVVAARRVLDYAERAEFLPADALRPGVVQVVAYMMGFGPDEADRAARLL